MIEAGQILYDWSPEAQVLTCYKVLRLESVVRGERSWEADLVQIALRDGKVVCFPCVPLTERYLRTLQREP